MYGCAHTHRGMQNTMDTHFCKLGIIGEMVHQIQMLETFFFLSHICETPNVILKCITSENHIFHTGLLTDSSGELQPRYLNLPKDIRKPFFLAKACFLADMRETLEGHGGSFPMITKSQCCKSTSLWHSNILFLWCPQFLVDAGKIKNHFNKEFCSP